MDNARPERKTPAHPPVVEPVNRTVIVFVTVCTDKRKPILARHDAHDLVVEAWNKAASWLVGRYVVMPDHVHLFCAPVERDRFSVTKWVHYWKAFVSRAWPWPEEQPIWQKSFWDTQLRKGESYDQKWEYVRQNPVREGLVASSENWPYQGELNLFTWHG